MGAGIDSCLRTPPPDLVDAVRAFYWHDLRPAPALSPAQRRTRIPPGPYNAVVWMLDGRAELIECAGQPVSQPLPRTFVAGAHRHPYRSEALTPYCSFGLVLQPGVLALLSGLDGAAWRDRIHDAEQTLPADWQPWLKTVHDAADHDQRIALCCDFLRPRWQALAQAAPGWAHLLRHAWRRHSLAPTLALLNWTRRHFQRRAGAATGLRPGEVERWLRVERAMLDLRDGRAAGAQAAAEHGFADQAHFSREVRQAFARSPIQLLRRLDAPEGDEDWLLRL